MTCLVLLSFWSTQVRATSSHIVTEPEYRTGFVPHVPDFAHGILLESDSNHLLGPIGRGLLGFKQDPRPDYWASFFSAQAW